MPDPLPGAEDASSFVLDQLDPEARARFEAELARSPELQTEVDDLRLVAEALALAAPPCPPPARAWEGIAARTTAAPNPGPVRSATSPATSALWRQWLGWLTNGWAAAAVLAVAFGVHLLFERPDPSPARHTSPPSGAGDGVLVERSNPRLAPSNRPSSAVAATSGLPGNAPTNDALLATQANAQLRDRVRLLSEQVALLSRILTQRAVVPAGASRLQVFRLISTNASLDSLESTPEPRGNPSPLAHNDTVPTQSPKDDTATGTSAPSDPDVALALAMAAARQLAAYTPPSTTPTRAVSSAINQGGIGPNIDSTSSGANPPLDPSVASPDTTAPGAALAHEPILFVDLASPATSPLPTTVSAPTAATIDPGVVSANQDSAFGAYSPDSGTGAVAFRLPTENTDQGVYQLWITEPTTGAIQSLGFANASPGAAAQVLVMKFSTDATAFSAPTFIITREPTGGSLVPTGPVVAVPPTTSPSP